MKFNHFISSIFWLAMGILLTIWAISYPIGSFSQPGPGLYPLVLGILLIFLSLNLLFGKIKKNLDLKEISSPIFTRGGWKKVGYTVLILILATFFFERIGYLFTFFLLIMLLMIGAGHKSWKRILLISFFSALGIYIIFVLLLKQPLPRGFLRV